MPQHDEQQWHQQLVEAGGGEGSEAAQIGGSLGVCEHRSVLAVSFEKDGLPRHGIDPGFENRQRGRGTKRVMAIMDHAMRVAVGLGEEYFFCCDLLFGALRLLIGDAGDRQHAGGNKQRRDNQCGRNDHFRPQPQTPFFARYAGGAAHAVSRSAKAACTVSVSMRSPGSAAKLPTSLPRRSSPTRSAT